MVQSPLCFVVIFILWQVLGGKLAGIVWVDKVILMVASPGVTQSNLAAKFLNGVQRKEGIILAREKIKQKILLPKTC